MFALGYSFFPTLVGFLLALACIKLMLKTRLIRQLKLVAYGVSLFWSTTVMATFFTDWGSSAVAVPVVIGFVVTFLVALIFCKPKADAVALTPERE